MPMPGNVSQGPTLRRISEGSRDSNKIERALADLQQGTKSLIQIAEEFSFVRTDGERDHLANHWLGDIPWFPNEPYVESILRQGFIEACEMALKRRVPIEAYWTCAGPEAKFEVSACGSLNQVTLIIATPSVPEAAHDIWRGLPLTDNDPIVTVRRGPLETDAYGVDVKRTAGQIIVLRMKTRVADG